MNIMTVKNTVITTLLALLLAGCDVLLEPVQKNEAVSTGGRTIIRIGETAAGATRSLVPTTYPEFSKYELEFTADGRESVYRTLTTTADRNAINGGSGYAVDLVEGAWTINVGAFVSGMDGNLKAAQGTSSVTVSAGNLNTSANITLAPLSLDGSSEGIFTWNLSAPAGVIVNGTLTRIVDGNLSPAVIGLSGVTGSRPLAAGYYLLGFTLNRESDGASAGVSRVVHIYSGLTTKAEGPTFTFTDVDFAAQKFLAGTVTVSGISSAQVDWIKVRPYKNAAFKEEDALAEATMQLAQGGAWFFSIPADRSDVYFQVTLKKAGNSYEYKLNGGSQTELPANGKKNIALTPVYSTTSYQVTFAKGEGGGTPPATLTRPLGEAITLPGQGSMTVPSGGEQALVFDGWKADGTNYAAGYSFVVTGNTAFTAQWKMTGYSNPLKAKAFAPSTGDMPLILYSYADTTGYTYLFDAGRIENMYIGNMLSISYSGVAHPVLTTTTTDSSTTQATLTTTTADVYSFSNTSSVKTSINAEISAKVSVPGASLSTSLKAGLEDSWSNTNTGGTTKSTTNTNTTSNAWATSRTLVYPTFGDNDHITGTYRRAIYGTCDVFFVIKTSRDKQTLLKRETIVCARPGSFNEAGEFSSTGTFNNEPENEITFKSEFYKDLPEPIEIPTYSATVADNNEPYTIPSDMLVAHIKGKDSGQPATGVKIVVAERAAGNDLKIIVENLKFTAPVNSVAIDASSFPGKLTVEVRGVNEITGGRGADGNGTNDGQDSVGRNGGAAIYRSSGLIKIQPESGGTLTLTGGRGGDGIGYHGNAGGAGGNGIYCSSGNVVLKNANVTGGAGGNGGNGHHYENWFLGIGNYNTIGGDGGGGGYAVVAIASTPSASNAALLVTLTGGSKGAVGKKGNGDSGNRNDGKTAGGAYKTP